MFRLVRCLLKMCIQFADVLLQCIGGNKALLNVLARAKQYPCYAKVLLFCDENRLIFRKKLVLTPRIRTEPLGADTLPYLLLRIDQEIGVMLHLVVTLCVTVYRRNMRLQDSLHDRLTTIRLALLCTFPFTCLGPFCCRINK